MTTTTFFFNPQPSLHLHTSFVYLRRSYTAAEQPQAAPTSTSPSLVLTLLFQPPPPSPSIPPLPSRCAPTTVTTASSGQEALALLERNTSFNLLLTDVMMPDVDGPTLLHYVRTAPFYQEMPVVMMSSNEHAEVVLNCIRLGAEDYLLKPVTKKAVKHMWAHVWRRKQRHQMVPRFENGQEVTESDDFDSDIQMRGMGGHGTEMDGVLPVPSTEEYSSDGGSEDMDDVAGRQRRNIDDDIAAHDDARQYYASVYFGVRADQEGGGGGGDGGIGGINGYGGNGGNGGIGGSGGGDNITNNNSRSWRPGGAMDVPVTTAPLGAGGGGGGMDGDRGGVSGGASGSGRRAAVPTFELTPDGQCPFAHPGKKMEKVEEGEMEGEEGEMMEPADGTGTGTGTAAAAHGPAGAHGAGARQHASEIDPLLVQDAATGAVRKLRPVPSIRGLSSGRSTLRAWIDTANAASTPVGQQDRLHVLKQTATLLAGASIHTPITRLNSTVLSFTTN